jgi:hypothetical protein
LADFKGPLLRRLPAARRPAQARDPASSTTWGIEMMRRATDREHAMALQRLEEAEKRIAHLQTQIQKLKEDGQPILEAERLLDLMRQSRASMQQQADLFAKDKT